MDSFSVSSEKGVPAARFCGLAGGVPGLGQKLGSLSHHILARHTTPCGVGLLASGSKLLAGTALAKAYLIDLDHPVP